MEAANIVDQTDNAISMSPMTTAATDEQETNSNGAASQKNDAAEEDDEEKQQNVHNDDNVESKKIVSANRFMTRQTKMLKQSLVGGASDSAFFNDDADGSDGDDDFDAAAVGPHVQVQRRRRQRYLSLPDERVAVRNMLSRAVFEAGRYSYGIVAVDVHILNADTGRLVVPDGGFWVDPAFVVSCPSNALDRLVNEARVDYISPPPVLPGEGLFGLLWVESQLHYRRGRTADRNQMNAGPGRSAIGRSPRNRSSSLNDSFDTLDEVDNIEATKELRWRNIQMICEDPDQPPNERLKLFNEAGIGLAAAVRFNVRGHEGIVTYMARSAVDLHKLNDPDNIDHLSYGAYLIGAICAFEQPRTISLEARRAERAAAKAKLRHGMMKLNALTAGFKKDEADAEATTQSEKPPQSNEDAIAVIDMSCQGSMNVLGSLCSRSKQWMQDTTLLFNPQVYLRKLNGSNISPPPPQNWDQTFWTFMGAFVTFLLWYVINETFEKKLSESLTRGSFGSFVSALYTLMAAPASQPRNAFLSQVVTGLVVLPINYIPRLPEWIRISLGPSLSIAATAKLGVVHPTSGGDALLYASMPQDWRDDQWQQYGYVLFNYAFAIVLAVILNNLSSRRQYPIYWGYSFNFIRQKVAAISTSRKRNAKKE